MKYWYHKSFLSGSILALILFVLFFPFFFFDYTFVPLDLLKWSFPWGDGQYISIQNHYAWDVTRHTATLQRFIAESLSRFELPLWNPYNGLGMPMVSMAVPVFLDVFFSLYLISSQLQMDHIVTALKLWTAGMGLFILARSYGVSSAGAVLGGIVFMLNGAFPSQHAFYRELGALLWTPYVVLFLEKSLQTMRARNILVASVFLALAHLAGNAQNILQIGLFLLIWMLSKIIMFRQDHSPSVIFMNLSFVYLLSVLLAAVGFLPFFELVSNPFRVSRDFSLLGWILKFPEHLQKIPFIVSLAFPHFFGNSSIFSLVSLVNEQWVHFVYGYAGLFPLLLAILAASWSTGTVSRQFRFIGIAVLVIIFLTPLVLVVYMRFQVFWCFSIAILSGFGLDLLTKQENRIRLLGVERLVLRLGSIVILAWFAVYIFIEMNRSLLISIGYRFIEDLKGKDYIFFPFYKQKIFNTISYYNFDNPKLIFTLLLLFCFAILINLLRRGILSEPVVKAGVILLVCLDLGSFFLSYVSYIDLKEHPYYKADASIEFLQKNTTIERSLIIDEPQQPWILPDFTNLMFNLYLTQGSMDFVLPSEAINFDFLTPLNHSYLNFVNTKYIVEKSSKLDPVRFPIVYDGSLRIHLNPEAMPRAFTVGSFQQFRSQEDVLAMMHSEHVSYQDTVYLLETPTITDLGPATPGDDVTIESYAAREVHINTRHGHHRILVFSDVFDPGWTALLDGVPTPIYKANAIFRAVVLPAGTHHLEFHYQPDSVRIGSWISILSLVGVVLGLFYFSRHAGKRHENRD
ncbi:MAG: YfhO family protein [Magnetococcales bacterium]|nr:YfhO family protein [Magnetococcales bacterium]MBF0151069.1 YfhO family protein [Magnetococcales bacterium]